MKYTHAILYYEYVPTKCIGKIILYAYIISFGAILIQFNFTWLVYLSKHNSHVEN